MLEVIYLLKTHCLYFWSGTNIQKHLFSKTELRKKKRFTLTITKISKYNKVFRQTPDKSSTVNYSFIL